MYVWFNIMDDLTSVICAKLEFIYTNKPNPRKQILREVDEKLVVEKSTAEVRDLLRSSSAPRNLAIQTNVVSASTHLPWHF